MILIYFGKNIKMDFVKVWNKDYPYFLRTDDDSSSLVDKLEGIYTQEGKYGSSARTNGELLLVEGQHTILGIDLVVCWEDLSRKNCWLFFRSKEDAIKLEKMVNEFHLNKESESAFVLYKFRCHMWDSNGVYEPFPPENYVGYEDYTRRILSDIENFEKHRVYLNSVGAYPSLNYLLYGPPGVGKTSLVKLIATMLKGAPILTVNDKIMINSSGTDVLSPVLSRRGKCIILFEDFDRYLNSKQVDMPNILNALDGVEKTTPVIRFFTANDPGIVVNNKALYTRMTACLRFDNPTTDAYKIRAKRLLSFRSDLDQNKIDILAARTAVMGCISMRTFTAYVVRYMFAEDCLSKMIENLREVKL